MFSSGQHRRRASVDERIGFVLYQSYGDSESVGRVSVFWFWWCM